jgi:hypothetical protein
MTEQILCRAFLKGGRGNPALENAITGRCQQLATRFYRTVSIGPQGPQGANSITCRCEKHPLGEYLDGIGWGEISYEDAVVIWVHES